MLEREQGKFYSAPETDIRPKNSWNNVKTGQSERNCCSIKQLQVEASSSSHLLISKQLEGFSKTQTTSDSQGWRRSLQVTRR